MNSRSTSTKMVQVPEVLDKCEDSLSDSEKTTQEQNQTEEVLVSFIFNSYRLYSYLPVVCLRDVKLMLYVQLATSCSKSINIIWTDFLSHGSWSTQHS